MELPRAPNAKRTRDERRERAMNEQAAYGTYRIRRIAIEGFRRLRSLDIPVRPFMVLIGANGVGKTSFLDALTLLSASAAGRLSETLSLFGGVAKLLTRGKCEEIALAVEMDVPGYEPLRYRLQMEPRGAGSSITQETLLQQNSNHPRPFFYIDAHHGRVEYYNTETKRLDVPDWDYNPGETALSQVPKMFRQPEALRRVLATATQYHTLDVGPRAPVKLPQPVKPAALPGANGEALLPFLYSLRESDRPRFEAVTDALRAAYPDFEELTFPPAAAGMLALSWKDKKFESPIYADELSEGTLRFLWLTALLQSPELSTVTMIDEPEVSLHPELLDLLAQLMREASARTQLIVTTHSDRFVRFLKPDEVYVMDVGEEGEATITPADTLDLDCWLDEYSLDEVWRMGRMGGRA